MQARIILCLLALACLMAGAEAKQQNPELPDIKLGEIRNTVDIIGAENLTLTVGYAFSGMMLNTTRLPIDPTKKYVLMLIECEV